MKPDSDGFIKVTYKGKKNRSCRKPTSLEISAQHQQVDTENGVFDKNKFNLIKDDLKRSSFFTNFEKTLQCTLTNFHSNVDSNVMDIENLTLNDKEIIDIVCYGLGKFMSCMIARYQLAFLILLNDIMSPRTISIFDPAFSDKEKSILVDFGMNVSEENLKGKKAIFSRTIFFMPHCDIFLYNNLLYANWSKESLAKLILIGNSFQQYKLDSAERHLREKAIYIWYASDFVKEIKIKNDLKYSDIFNNSSIHYFPVQALCEVAVDVWNDKVEPVYEGDDELIKKVSTS